MDAPTAISTLQALRNTLADEVKGAQAKLDALDVALILVQNGYQSDVEAAKAALQPELDARDEQITALANENADLSGQLTARQAALIDPAPEPLARPAE